jgi:hypothetical protein
MQLAGASTGRNDKAANDLLGHQLAGVAPYQFGSERLQVKSAHKVVDCVHAGNSPLCVAKGGSLGHCACEAV